MNKQLIIFVILSFIQQVAAQMGDNEGESQPDLPDHILNMESPVLTTKQALAAFVLQEGFKIELVASEPMFGGSGCCDVCARRFSMGYRDAKFHA